MRWKWLFATLLLSLVGVALAQPSGAFFTPVRQFGRLRPTGIQYDPNFHRLALVDTAGQLTLVDAATFQPQHVLYPQGAYNAYTFSHDGQTLALAIDRRVELWDTQTGALQATFEPPAAKLVQGPLRFGQNDDWLLLDSVVPAPLELRRSENDTVSLPWLWDLPAARRQARSTRLPSLASAPNAYPFFSLKFPDTLLIGPNDTLLAGIPERLQVINAQQKEFPVITEIPAARLESDPIYVWQSLTDDLLYVNTQQNNTIVQADAASGTTFNIPLGRDLNYSNLDSMAGLRLSSTARILGAPVSQRENSLLRLLFGDDYLAYQNFPRLTVTLVDILHPLTMPADQMGLLIYSFNEDRGSGMLEIIRPPDVQQMVLHPDHNRLLVRRTSGRQALEVYNLDTGVLERSYYPAEPDGTGAHLLAYNAAGDVILTDFQQFDATTGAVLYHDGSYTAGFQQVFFTADSQKIVTLRGPEWRLWDIHTGALVQEAALHLRGSVMDQSPDAFRYLTRFSGEGGEVIEIVDVAANERRSFTIPNLPGRSIEQIIPSADWQNYLVVYTAQPGSQHYPGNEIAVYHFTQGQRLFLAGDDLPAPEGRQYGWLDADTVYISSGNPYGGSQPARIYGVDYHASGVPNCLTAAFPEQWSAWPPVWEGLALSLSAEQLNRLAERLCAALPDDANAVLPALTPTRPYVYDAAATPAPVAIPGVPVCLTSRFPRDAVKYAALWREMAAGLPPEQVANLETMLCEGLIGSVSSVAPTPTVNPNQLSLTTPTPLPAAPVTTDGGQAQIGVMTVNIATGQRLSGTYLPALPDDDRDLSLIQNLFYAEQQYYPSSMALSPDGTLFAVTDASGYGFVIIYRLAKSYAALLAEETDAQATRQASAPHSIGLQPTATPPFNYVGEPRPTMTPTMTTTPPPRPETTAAAPPSEDVCPAMHLYDVAAPPPAYAASGRLFAAPMTEPYVMWVLEPATGRLYPDDTLPRCGLDEGCDFSFDQEWMLRRNETIVVSRPDGSQPREVFRAEEAPVWPGDFRWLNQHTLEYRYDGYLPDKYSSRVALIRHFDPVSGQRTDPFQPLPEVQVNGLPTYLIARQPNGALDLLTTPYNNGAKYYLYDRATGTADYFARVDSGALEFYWHPLGRYLYYRYPDQTIWYEFNASTRQHRRLGADLPPTYGGLWSRDGRYTVNWYEPPFEDQQQYLAAGLLFPRLSIWDSDTGLTRRYCLPETGTTNYNGTPLLWSPDNRYLAFTVMLPIESDSYLTPMPTAQPDILLPTATPIPLETQFQYRTPRTLILDTMTGSVTVISTEVSSLILWTDGGSAE